MDKKIKAIAKEIPHKSKKVKKDFKSLLKADKKMDAKVEMCEGKKIPTAKLKKAEKAGGKLGKRARLADTLGKLGKK